MRITGTSDLPVIYLRLSLAILRDSCATTVPPTLCCVWRQQHRRNATCGRDKMSPSDACADMNDDCVCVSLKRHVLVGRGTSSHDAPPRHPLTRLDSTWVVEFSQSSASSVWAAGDTPLSVYPLMSGNQRPRSLLMNVFIMPILHAMQRPSAMWLLYLLLPCE